MITPNEFLKWLLVFDVNFGGAAGSGVDSLTGTEDQIIASSPEGDVILSLPQSIATTSSPTFAGLTLGTSVLTLGGSLTTSGAFASTFTMIGITTVTFPTTGTLATTADASGIVNIGAINQLAYYAAAGAAVSGLATANNGLLVTSAAGVPSIGNAVLADITINTVRVGLGGGNVATNTVVGSGALAATATGTNNVAIGRLSLAALLGGNSNTAIGTSALQANTTGGANVAVGLNALLTNVSGSENVAVGNGALQVSTGINNTAVGTGSSIATTSGVRNATFGYHSNFNNSTGTDNAVFGANALTGLGAKSQVVAMGSNSLSALTTGGNNVGIGYSTGVAFAAGSAALTTGSSNTLLGFQASVNNAATIGTIAIGSNAVADIATGATSGDNGPGIAIGSAAFKVGFRGDGTIYPGNLWRAKINGTYYMLPLQADGDTAGAVLLNPTALQTITNFDLVVNTVRVGLGGGNIASNTAIGLSALAANTTGSTHTALGAEAYNAASNAVAGNTAIGYRAVFGSVSPGQQNTLVGALIASGGSFSGARNTSIGHNTLAVATSASSNCTFGFQSGNPLTTGSNNCLFGFLSGALGATGALALTTGANNTLLGFQAGVNAAATIGAISIGANAVADIATGATSGDNGPGIAIGSASFPVGFRGDGTIYAATGAAAGYLRIKINGTYFKVALNADA